MDAPTGIAVDANGKIYVVNDSGGSTNTGSVTAYAASGTQTMPTITAGINEPDGVAVGANGRIYVANYTGPGSKGGFGSVTTYTANGMQIKPTIIKGIVQPGLLTLH